MAISLLQTKIYQPSTHPGCIPRQRLVAYLDEDLWVREVFARKLTLISAPAGYGKTTLVAEWIANQAILQTHQKHPPFVPPAISWYSLDENDNDSIRFWTYVIATLQKACPDTGKTTQAMLLAVPPPAADVMLTALINDIIESSIPRILVLDDYQMIHTQAIHEALAFLIEYLPSQMHLVLITRVDPPINLARLRIRRQMAEVRADDLRFTLDEAVLFLNKVMKLDLTPENIAALEVRTEGWIAGLQVAAMAMQGREDIESFIEAFTGSHRHVLSYLIEEVFQRQSENIKTFLLRTSILHRLCGSLCNVLTGCDTGQETLEYLEASNLFLIPLDDEQHWYRYHHLFGEVLQVKLQHDYPLPEIQAMHRSARTWYEEHGQVNEAVRHTLIGGDYEHLAALIEQFADGMIRRSELLTLQRWLDALPETMVRTSAKLSMISAWVLLASNQIEAVEPRLHDIEMALGLMVGQVTDIAALPAALRGAFSEVLCIRANLAFHHTDLPSVLTLSRQALDCLTDDVQMGLFNTLPVLRGVIAFNTALAHEYSGRADQAEERFIETMALSRPIENTHLIMMSFSHLAQMQRIQGHIHQAAKTYEQAIRFAAESALPQSPFLGMVHVGLGNVWYEWNDLTRAQQHLQQGIAMAQPWHNWETLVAGYLGLARIEVAQGHWDAGEHILADLISNLPSLQSPWSLPLIQAQRAYHRVKKGDLVAGAEWIRQIDLTAESDLLYVREPETIILARILSALGRLDDAARLLALLHNATEAGKRSERTIEILICQCLVFQAQGQHEAAMNALICALTMAGKQGYVRLFVDEGPALAAMLAQIKDRSPYVMRLLTEFRNTVSTTSHASENLSAGLPGVLVDTLSERELELLRLMAEGLTNREIAEALTVSLNTVKTHAHSIYGKLDVRNRTEATARARELGFL